MKVIAAAATDVGRVREGNEDSYLSVYPLFAVADGMGGHRGGEVASQIAVETLEAMFKKGEGELPDQVQEANRAVFERSVTDRKVAGMGTTLTVALVQDDRIRLAHVGDSRAYLLRDGELRLLTEDHTLVHRMVSEGEISEQEAETHPQRSVLTRALGVDMVVDVDDDTVRVRPGDRVLLCTDGLTSMLSEDRIREILSTVRDPRQAAERLVREANEAGGVDNTTVVVLDFTDDGSPDGSGGPSIGTTSTVGEVAARPEAATAGGGRRPSPLRGRRFPTRKVAIWAGAAVLAIVLGLVGLRLYLDSQWYVGVSNGHVAVFRGIPTEVAGFDLHHVVLETRIDAAAAERLAVWRELPDGMTADSRERAASIVEQIRKDVERQQAQRHSGSSKPGGSSP